jgi:hypothetical protein
MTTTAKPSLYSLTLESQEIDGELAIAMAKLTSGDEAEQQEAEAMITALLERSADTSNLLNQKANAICHIHEALLGKAAYLRQVAADRLAKAEDEEKAAENLLHYLTRMLALRNPGQSKFALAEYTVKRSTSQAVETDDSAVPPEHCRFEIKVKLDTGHQEAADQVVAVVTEALRDQLELPASAYDISVKPSADKTGLKSLLAGGMQIPGAQLVSRTRWSVK